MKKAADFGSLNSIEGVAVMRKTSTAELRELEVINLCGGERLGYPFDFELDLECGKLISMSVKDQDGIALFAKKEEYIIPWCKIECIGEDAILVRLNTEEISSCLCDKKKGKKGKKCR